MMQIPIKDRPSYIVTAEDVLALKISEIPMLIPPILQKVGIASLCGGSDVGKSFLCLCIAIAICGDSDEGLGLKIKKQHGSVLIVCTEDAVEDICVRLTLLLKNRKIKTENLRFIFETDNLVAKIKEELHRQPADLIIIDTLGDLFTGNLNSSIEVRQFLHPFKKIAQAFKCLILFNHHIGKGKEYNYSPSKNDVLGSQGIESASRTVLMLKKRADGKRILTVVKGNYISDDLKNKGMVLDFHPATGFQPTGETISFSEADLCNHPGKNDDPILEDLVLSLYLIHRSYLKVATILRERGYKIDKNKVGLLLKKHHPSVLKP